MVAKTRLSLSKIRTVHQNTLGAAHSTTEHDCCFFVDRLQSDSSHAIDFSAHEMSAHGSSGFDLRKEYRRMVSINFVGERNAVARLLPVNGSPLY